MEENNNEKVEVLDETKKIETATDDKEKQKKNSVILIFAVVGAILALFIIAAVLYLSPSLFSNNGKNTTKKAAVDSKGVLSEYRMSGNSLEDFDLVFMKLQNDGKNKVYSPLSIKYALAMLSEASSGTTKDQITAVIGDYKSKKYPNNEHMSFANAMFIRNSFKSRIKDSYTANLKDKYNAEVVTDEFKNADSMNSWVSNKTFNLVNNLFDSEKVKDEDFILTNALAIDMNWNNQIQCTSDRKISCIKYNVTYEHEKYKTDYRYAKTVAEIATGEEGFYPLTFNGKENVKSSEIAASFNRYDAVKEIGEDKIRKEVGDAYREWLKTPEGTQMAPSEWYPSDVDKYLDKYIKELNSNYNKEAFSTDFMLYTDDNVKVFAKDLKEYEGTTLQYVGIMPIKEDLSKYVEEINAEKLNEIIKNLKEMKKENFKDGVVTLVRGRIPMFDYETTIDLTDELPKLGIKDVFNIEKSNLSGMLKKNSKAFIADAPHKAKIEFSNDGIKAAAATGMGGAGAAGAGFDYYYKIPVEEIDLTIDKPFMYIIRDKKTGEVWFTGTVYEGKQRAAEYNPYGYYNQDSYKQSWDNYQ